MYYCGSRWVLGIRYQLRRRKELSNGIGSDEQDSNASYPSYCPQQVACRQNLSGVNSVAYIYSCI